MTTDIDTIAARAERVINEHLAGTDGIFEDRCLGNCGVFRDTIAAACREAVAALRAELAFERGRSWDLARGLSTCEDWIRAHYDQASSCYVDKCWWENEYDALCAELEGVIAELEGVIAERDALRAELAASRAACVCGCPLGEHEDFPGRTVVCCEHNDDECLLTSEAVAAELTSLRNELTRVRAEVATERELCECAERYFADLAALVRGESVQESALHVREAAKPAETLLAVIDERIAAALNPPHTQCPRHPNTFCPCTSVPKQVPAGAVCAECGNGARVTPCPACGGRPLKMPPEYEEKERATMPRAGKRRSTTDDKQEVPK